MITLWAQLMLMLIIILIASQLFTNALEYFGHKIGISAGVTGSIFAAIATALPETMVPVIALLAGSPNKEVNQEIGVGAILGAPLMLSTLSTLLLALFAIKGRGIRGKIEPEKKGFIRDLNFFLCAFFLAAVAMYVPLEPNYYRRCISFFLICVYLIYIAKTCYASKKLVIEGHGISLDEPLILSRLGLKNTTPVIFTQLILAFILLLYGAHGFIDGVEHISSQFGVSALLLALIVIPLATELPEKVNSIIWIRKNKDTLAFGNITGAMVFQGAVLPALGILLTPWQPTREVQVGIFITFAAAAWLRINASAKGGISILALLLNGGFYFLYLYLTLILVH